SSPFWISDNGTGLVTLYNGFGAKASLAVTIPGLVALEAGKPTGQVFKGNASAFNGDPFIFATEDGTIAGWRGALGTTAEVLANASNNGAIYKGLAIGVKRGFTY